MNYNKKLEYEITKFVHSNIPLIFLQKFSLEEVEKTIRSFKNKNHGDSVFHFNITQGFVQNPTVELSDYDVLFNALVTLLKEDKQQLVVIHGAESLFNSQGSDESEKLIEILSVFMHKVQTNKYFNTTIIFNGIHYDIPPKLRDGAMIIESSLPEKKDIYNIVKEFINTNNIEGFINTDRIDPNLIENLKGLSYYEIMQALSFIFYEFGIKVFNNEIDKNISKEIYTIKEQMLKKMGTLSIIETSESVEDIIGLDNLKEYIEEEKSAFQNRDLLNRNGIDLPKGILILGEPGTGKSMTAKATANTLGLKLIKFDISKIMGKYVGDSEKNIIETLKVIEHMSPCVLWIDELEKAFSGVNDNDNQVLRRVFGILLSWMSDDNNKGAFVVGTANNIDGVLPPEFLRKGRFDEIFYVSKPTVEARLLLFKDKLSKRKISLTLNSYESRTLAKESNGFTGADIEYICNRAARKFYLIKASIGTNRYSKEFEKLLFKEVKLVQKNKESEFTLEKYSNLNSYYSEIYKEEIAYLNNEHQDDLIENKISKVLEEKMAGIINEDIEKILNKKLNRGKYRNADSLIKEEEYE